MPEDAKDEPTQDEPQTDAPQDNTSETAETPQAADDQEPQAKQTPAEGPQGDEMDAEEVQADTEGEQEEEDDGLPECTFDIEDAGMLRKKITITVPAERIEAKRDEMFGELSNSAQVPGFRIGRAPRRLIEKRFGREIGEDVRNAMVGESLGQLDEKTELKTIGQPDLKLEDIELPEEGPMVYSFEVEVAPEFDLPELEGIEVTRTAGEVTDERVEEQLENWRTTYATYEATDAAAEEGGVVVADVTISGEGLEALERTAQELRVAPGQVEGIPLVDLGKALAGKTAGETATLTTDVAEAHPNEAWRGKTVEVALAVTEVRRRVLPELDDDFAQNYGLDTMNELRTLLKQSLQSQVEQEARGQMRSQVQQYLLANTELDVPEEAANRSAARVLQRRYIELLQRGVPRERIDENLTELQAAAGEEARSRMKLEFILAEIAEGQAITVEEDEVNARVAMMAQQYERRPERLRQELEADGSIDQVRASLRDEKVLEYLLDKANIVEAAEDEAEGDDDAAEDSPKKKAKKAKKAKEAKKADDGDEAEDKTDDQADQE